MQNSRSPKVWNATAQYWREPSSMRNNSLIKWSDFWMPGNSARQSMAARSGWPSMRTKTSLFFQLFFTNSLVSLPRQFFALQMDKLEKPAEQRVRTTLAHDLSQIAPYLLTRGRCLLGRDWEGDKMDAIRDFLSLLRISPSDKEAHSNLLKCLYKMKQQTASSGGFS